MPLIPASDIARTVDIAVTEVWEGGFLASLNLKNEGTEELDGWSAELRHRFDIVDIWGATATATASGSRIAPLAGAAPLAPGQTATVTFQAEGAPADLLTPATAPPAGGTTLPTLQVADARGTVEGTPLAFHLTLDAPAPTPVSVAYELRGLTATAGEDVAPERGVVTFEAGATHAVVKVTTTDDASAEAGETVRLVLREVQGAEPARPFASGTIVDDDRPVAAPGPLTTDGNAIVDAAGVPVVLAGVSWFGLETERGVPDGLAGRNWRDMMDQIEALGFNTIRLPFSNAALEPDSRPQFVDPILNPDLVGLSSLEVMDRVVDYAGRIGLRIILDNHRSTAGDGPEENGLWYTAGYDEARWIADWERLAARYADAPAVVGADLRNEPFAGVWGGGGPQDWAAAAERAGNAVLAVDPDWLVLVEGVAEYGGETFWWGGDLRGVADRPIDLDRPEQLVYSPHVYSGDVADQPWHDAADYPANLPAIWDEHFGFIHQQDIAPLLVGEFGNRYADVANRQWLDSFAAYIGGDFDVDGTSDLAPGETGFSFAYWSWNPNSSDTGGLLADDWRTPIAAKLDVLAPLITAAPAFATATAGPDGAVVDLGFDVDLGEDWYHVDVTLTNHGERAVTGWSLALAGLPAVEDVWNAVVAFRGAGVTGFASDAGWADTIAPGETINIGVSGDPGDALPHSLTPAALEATAVFDADWL
jgi:chitinase